MQAPVSSLFAPAPATLVEAEPVWLAQARRRNQPYLAASEKELTPAVADRRALLAAYDAQAAALTAAEARLAEAATVLHPGGSWTVGLEANRQQLQKDYFAMKCRAQDAEARATEAEARVAEMQQNLRQACVEFSEGLANLTMEIPELGETPVSPYLTPQIAEACRNVVELLDGAAPVAGSSAGQPAESTQKMVWQEDGYMRPPCWPCPFCLAKDTSECLGLHCVHHPEKESMGAGQPEKQEGGADA